MLKLLNKMCYDVTVLKKPYWKGLQKKKQELLLTAIGILEMTTNLNKTLKQRITEKG